ncbi:hypothetical protein [Actinomadura rupiterrae]|uniref:hypothetical protein n=1 Tax=Actinomadura rupiterrae TaxID=559627 RepID=UPI0020A4FE55|nr:hypothetical protein [Actinomadura rupiterrae]MCP2337835.1 hypothetical protein [Actinomadura rupiterrae]
MSSRNPSGRAPRRFAATALAAVAAVGLAGCGGGGGSAGTGANGRAALALTGYTSDQLKQALLTDITGYQRVGEPDSGEYGSLKGIQNFSQLQRQVTLDKPRCANAAGAHATVDKTVPAALTSFNRGDGQVVTETLMGMPDEAAQRQLALRVPADCMAFRTRVGTQWSEHRVTEIPGGAIGKGSRTVGVSTVSGNSNTKAWYVVLRGRHCVATVSLFGPNATRDEVEQLARQAYDRAEHYLP